MATLEDVVAVLGPTRLVCLQRELTKTYETIELRAASELLDWVRADSNQQRGEMVLIIGGVERESNQDLDPEILSLAQALEQELPAKKVSKILAEHSGVSKKALYQALLDLKKA